VNIAILLKWQAVRRISAVSTYELRIFGQRCPKSRNRWNDPKTRFQVSGTPIQRLSQHGIRRDVAA
jgi:hypothetical protein